jgi:8-oxo-dGTP pyrophosphatase MutT (NUDIX family)
LIGRLLHAAVFAFQAVRRSIWFFTEPEAVGVHGVALTSEGKIILVMLSYASGWRLPGGGKAKGEEHEAAMLRELREEIGMTAYDSIDRVTGFAHRPDHRHGNGTLFVVRGVHYRPRWSLEVKRVGEFDLDELPEDTARITRQLLAMAIE